LGFYITGHPLDGYEELLEKFTNANSIVLKEKNDGETIRVGGIVRDTKIIKTKKGDLMAFVNLEDLHGSIEVTVFSSLYVKVYDLLLEDTPLLVQGQIQKDENYIKMLADAIIPMDKAEEIWTTSIHINIDITLTEKSMLLELNDILKKYPGSCKSYIHLRNPDRTETVIALSDTVKLKAGRGLTREVNKFFGYDAVETICTPATSSV
jgi:DNA polymerase-3 subunit alpha